MLSYNRMLCSCIIKKEVKCILCNYEEVLEIKNLFFDINLNLETGTVSKMTHPDDGYEMNWCSDSGGWGSVHSGLIRKRFHRNPKDTVPKKELSFLPLVKIDEGRDTVVSEYLSEDIKVTVSRFFKDDKLVERYVFKNLREDDLFLQHGDMGILLPFNDVYTYAEDCMTNRCNTHIWCGENCTYVNALRMGKSDLNLGLVLTKGAIQSYSVYNAYSNHRGQFLMNLPHLELLSGEEYTVEWKIFWHKGKEDFIEKASEFDTFVKIEAPYFTVFNDEEIVFQVKAKGKAKITCDGELVPVVDGKVFYKPKRLGEYRFEIQAGDVKTYAEFFVSESLYTVVKKRLDFIVDKQQYKREDSPLYGAFLIYDNDEKHLVFDAVERDHNACRERLGMGLMMIKYLQLHKDEKLQNALKDYMAFVLREIVDVETGEVFDGVRRNAKYKRLYNAPWVTTLFVEYFLLTRDKEYLKYTLRILRYYYSNGGYEFYPNGLSMVKTVGAFHESGMYEEEKEAMGMFRQHVDNIVKKGSVYPKHEVNFEQTIVSPAATFTSEMGYLTKESIYIEEAGKHIETIDLFGGQQPSFHMHEVPIRYWDDYWFGKSRLFGDNFPHYWSCLTARSMRAYYKCSGNTWAEEMAEKIYRSNLCLFNEKGEGSCAYVYPYKVNGEKGAFYDGWANDQDFALYFYMDAKEAMQNVKLQSENWFDTNET